MLVTPTFPKQTDTRLTEPAWACQLWAAQPQSLTAPGQWSWLSIYKHIYSSIAKTCGASSASMWHFFFFPVLTRTTMMDIHLAPEEPFSSSCELFIIKLCPHSKIQKKHDMKNPTESIPHVGRLHYAWSPATYQKPQSHCYVALLLKSHSWPERDTGKLSAKSSPYPRCCCQDGIEMNSGTMYCSSLR